MPFIAQKKNTGKAVRPREIADEFHKKEDLECPYCGDALRFREKATDKSGNKLSSAHFWHYKRSGGDGNGGAGGCEAGGESPEHERSKLIVLDLLEERYYGTTFVERQIGARTADCGIEFEYPRGDKRGVVVEVQHKNKDKPYRDVTEEYLKHGFAVHWVFVINDDWDHLFLAKEKLENPNTEYWLGKIDLPDMDLGDQFWYNNYHYGVEDPADIIGEDHKRAKLKVDIPSLDIDASTYLVVERDSIDTNDPELVLRGLLYRQRPAKSIADFKFD